MNYQLNGSPEDVALVREGTSILFQDIRPAAQNTDQLQIHVRFQDTEQLSVTSSAGQITITCKEPAHYFRGLNRALHHLDEEPLKLTETVIFPQNGFMLDCSRNAVFTVDKVKSFLRTLAKLGMNEMLLYTEDTYEVPGEPYFGTYRGRYSQTEIRELDSYARIFGIELIPCIQTLAHLRNALRWPLGTGIKDTGDILLVGEERVYEFIEEMLSSVKETFSTDRVHLGMDEAQELGLGQYLNQNGYQESSRLMKEHSMRVFAICQKLGLKPMIWSDMYITSNTGKGYYDVDESTSTEGWEKPDAGLGLVYWDYYHEDENVYRNMLRLHKQLSGQLTFAGGAWIWNGISPNYSKAFACTLAALKTCREYGIPEIICTAWMDNGAETPVDAVYPGLSLFAHLGFHRELDKAAWEEEFSICIGGRLDDFYQLDAFDSLFLGLGENSTADNPSKFLLYQDSLLGLFDYHIQEINTRTYYRNLADTMKSCRRTSPAYKELFHFYQLLAKALSRKADLGLRIKEAYEKKDLSTLELFCEDVIPSLNDVLWKMKLLREQLWLRDAKPFGYELLDIKLGSVITRLESNRRRIRSYLDGSVAALEELEQPRLPYFPSKDSIQHDKNVPFSENKWNRIVSGCELIDTL